MSSSVGEGSERTRTSRRNNIASVKQPSFLPNIVVVPPTSQYQPAIIAQQNATTYSVPQQYSSQFINSSDLNSQQQLLNLYFSTGPTQYYREIMPPIPISQRIYSQQTPHPQFVTSTLIVTTPPPRSPLSPTAGTEFYYPLHDDLILLSQSSGLDGSNGIDPNLLNSNY
jgi:hypothetical protein